MCDKTDAICQASKMRKINKHFVNYIVPALIILWLLGGCTNQDKMFKESRPLMDTYCAITVIAPSIEEARPAVEAGFAEIEKLSVLLNYFSEDSEITAVNRAAGTGAVKVSKETMDILEKTLEVSLITSGAFDPTVAPVINHWDFSKGPDEMSVPSLENVKDALKLVDYRKVVINRVSAEVMLSDAGMEMDLGGIAKGYAADMAVNAIKAKGIKAALVSIAGDIRGFGVNISGDGWQVGIQDPRPENESERPWEDVFAVYPLEDMAISTSGDYQRYFFQDGKRYHHILDTVTGFPADSGLVSVSVVAPEGYLADSLSTAVFVMGKDRGIKLLESLGAGGVLIDHDKNVILTGNLRGKVKILKDDYKLAE